MNKSIDVTKHMVHVQQSTDGPSVKFCRWYLADDTNMGAEFETFQIDNKKRSTICIRFYGFGHNELYQPRPVNRPIVTLRVFLYLASTN